MNKNPFLNALAAIAYIALVATFMASVPHFFPEDPDTSIGAIPLIVGFLSLFVFSAAVMGYLIIGTPLQLFLEGQKKEALTYFGKTLAAFGGIAVVILGIAYIVFLALG